MKPFSESPQGEPQPGDNSTPQFQAQQRREAVERSRVERLLHAKADGQISESESAELTRLISDHARFAGEVKRSRLALDHMAILPPAPDFTARVLDHCADTVQFTTKPKRRSIRRERLALAACSIVLIIALVSTHRYWPGWTRSSARSEPLAKVLGAGQTDIALSFASLATSGKLLAGEITTHLASVPPTSPGAPALTGGTFARDTRLKLGNTSRFDKPVTGTVSSVALMASQSTSPGPQWISNQQMVFADDQWLLESLRPRGLAIAQTPVLCQIMAHYPPPSSRFDNSWLDSPQPRFAPDSHQPFSDWPIWPNQAD